jgi:tRNA-dihydrouridine synthase
MNIWQKLPKPFFILAPMEDVTDTVFRQVILQAGRPNLMFSEFTNCDGLSSAGREGVAHRLKFSKIEKPIIAQIWGKTPEHYFEAAKLVSSLGFDGVDINMGCPEKNVIRQGCCSALIKNHDMARQIIQATKDGAGGKIPVSVKTRIGFDSIDTQNWLGFLLEQNLDAIGLHGRTVKEKSTVPCHYDEIHKAVLIRNQKNLSTIIYANGDIKTIIQGKELCQKYGYDGVMIGRGIFENPWLFTGKEQDQITIKDRVELLQFHLELWEKTWKNTKHYPKLKKYFKIYIQNFLGSKNLRSKLMETQNCSQAKKILQDFAIQEDTRLLK